MKRNSIVYSVTKRIAQMVFSMFYRIETEENTLPDHGPVIILPKHQYWTDIPIISLAFKPLLYFVAKKELFEYPLIRELPFPSWAASLWIGNNPSGRWTLSDSSLFIESRREDRHLSGGNLLSRGSGVREKSAPSDDFKIPN